MPGVSADMLIANTPHLCISNGSACNSGTPEASHVLLAMGLDREHAECTVRVSLGRYNTQRDVDIATQVMGHEALRLLSEFAQPRCEHIEWDTRSAGRGQLP